MNNDEPILICTHATFRFACEELEEGIIKNATRVTDKKDKYRQLKTGCLWDDKKRKE